MFDKIAAAAGTTVTLTTTADATITGTVAFVGASFFNVTDVTGDTEGLRTIPGGVRLTYADVANIA